MNYLSKDGLTYLWSKIKSKVDTMLGEKIISADRTVYISVNGDDDTGDGSETSPWKTFAKAVGEAPVCNGGNYIIKVATEGTYDAIDISGKNINIQYMADITVPQISISDGADVTIAQSLTPTTTGIVVLIYGLTVDTSTWEDTTSTSGATVVNVTPAVSIDNATLHLNMGTKVVVPGVTVANIPKIIATKAWAYVGATNNARCYIQSLYCGAYGSNTERVISALNGSEVYAGTVAPPPGTSSMIFNKYLFYASRGKINVGSNSLSTSGTAIYSSYGGEVIAGTSLSTTSKDLYGAINENKSSISTLSTDLTTLNTNLTNGTTAVGKFGNITNIDDSYNTVLTGDSWIPTTNSNLELNHTTFNNLFSANIGYVALANMKTSIVSADYGSFVICIGSKLKILFLNMKITANGNIFSAFSGDYLPTKEISVNATWPIASTSSSYKSGYVNLKTTGIIALADAGTALLSGSYNILRMVIPYY